MNKIDCLHDECAEKAERTGQRSQSLDWPEFICPRGHVTIVSEEMINQLRGDQNKELAESREQFMRCLESYVIYYSDGSQPPIGLFESVESLHDKINAKFSE